MSGLVQYCMLNTISQARKRFQTISRRLISKVQPAKHGLNADSSRALSRVACCVFLLRNIPQITYFDLIESPIYVFIMELSGRFLETQMVHVYSLPGISFSGRNAWDQCNKNFNDQGTYFLPAHLSWSPQRLKLPLITGGLFWNCASALSCSPSIGGELNEEASDFTGSNSVREASSSSDTG